MQGRFEIGFIGWDLKEIGRFATERPTSGPAFMEAGADVWEVLEVDLGSEMARPGESELSVFGLTHVAGMYLGMEDQAAAGGTDAWYAMDEIAFYAESPPCAGLPTGDLTGDCRVDMADLAAMAGAWMADLAMP